MANVTETPEPIIDDTAVADGQALSIQKDIGAAIQGLNNPDGSFYTSIVGDDFAAKKKVLKAVTASTPVDEQLGKPIKLTDFVVQLVQIANSETSEINDAPRVILLDADGNAFHATSVGLLSSLQNILAIAGEPSTWDSPLEIKVVERKGNRGFKFMTIELV